MNKQEIEKQIKVEKSYLKCTQDTINQLENQLEKQLKENDELELVGGHYFDYVSNKYETTPEAATNKQIQNVGRCYPTKELAEIAMNNSNTRNKLEAYSRVIDPDWREGVYKHNDWYIYLNDSGEYIANNNSMKRLGEVRMSEKAAKRIAKALNNREITL